ncbi:MAG: MarR family transcriptional regulator [Selenomonas sp.]|jgi:DNA-binding MarR family transcriptional regulator|uniref:MarR family winged helix-turn-helix transcriptional regulator n=1 Tax=Selenomonas sp. AE3005 TaxID=1485543 RepID=UPI0004876A29|nr:MarR family transcriptional regulator [Selenomonas sp. AE3005]MBQ1417339.1 MarR family transcriptional regulator [Selenomonas sp.]MBQ2087560.1 MarR family transcriptional regulator [Selenomonas sp.]MBQ5420066.1 MarR family transcriptional regulator [Selenomonas sp.]MBQ5501678.1 MarR family transcriptional regulator [Selenomonas sp.]
MDEFVNWGRWFSILHRRSQLFVVEACQKYGLTFSEYCMLIRLYDREGSKQDELAAMLYLDKAVVTRTINLLVDKGFIVRQADTEDKRVRRIYMTEYGREQYGYLRNIIQGWIDYLVKDMDPAEVKGMFEGFHKLVDRACEADLVELAKHVPQGGERREKL